MPEPRSAQPRSSSRSTTATTPNGRVVGCAPRSQMRAENLPHAATSVAVRDADGRIYVHRRTDTKDLFPGAHDVWAGGVVAAGEEPARRRAPRAGRGARADRG